MNDSAIPIPAPAVRKPPGGFAFVFGILLPGATVLIELATRMCASTFFDPMPTWMMALLVGAVPVANLLLWRHLQTPRDASKWLVRLFGAAISVSAIFILVMLPLYPISVIAIIYMGLGLLPFAPLFAVINTVSGINRLAARQEGIWRQVRIGMLMGAGLLFLADLPVSATRLAVDMASTSGGKDQNAVTLMRWFGNEKDLLRMSYGASGNGGGLSSMLLLGNWTGSIWGEGIIDDAQTARQLYFRATGKSYNAERAPRGADGQSGFFGRGDADQGGSAVGGRLDTLSLASSRIDGSISAEDNLAYAEWTTEVRNAASNTAEARFTMALPEGAVASRATLWINGEPREASIAGRAETRAAYESVVRRQRDPLLVTTTGSGRLLVQAFPVPANGTMKFRVGYSAPLTIARDGSRSLAMPAIVEENFEIDPDLKHAVWFEGDALPAQKGWTATPLSKGAMKLQAVIEDEKLRTERPRIAAWPIKAASMRTGLIKGAKGYPARSAVQTITLEEPGVVRRLAVLVDGSITNDDAGEALTKALTGIAPGTPVSLMIAAEKPVRVATAPWSPEQRARFEEALNEADFAGGVDTLPALTQVLGKMTEGKGTLLWIHGPQPTDFPDSVAQLAQQLERGGANLPQLVRYQAAPGRAVTLEGQPWFETARMVDPTGNAAGDLQSLLSDLSKAGKRWQVSRAEATGEGVGSPHIVRLWAAQKLSSGGPFEGKARTEAIALAHQLNVITPVSGAVVLETEEDYRRNGLPVPSADKVPSVPEPHEWALIFMVIGFAVYALRGRIRRRSQAFDMPQGAFA
jgi:hypothetical protein